MSNDKQKHDLVLALEAAHEFIELANACVHMEKGDFGYTKEAGLMKAQALILRARLAKVRK